MSAKSDEDEVCACCGIAAVDDVKLEECNGGCDLVKYCSDKCCDNHREQHDEECKKRKAELHDKELFEQPDKTCFEECPLCFLPMPMDPKKSRFYSCCCKMVCTGCEYADYISNGGKNCPFCREPAVYTEKENRKRIMKRVKANDPAALHQMGAIRFKEGDYDGAFEYYTKAAKLGDSKSYFHSGLIGVGKDPERAIYHLEKAAIGGHPVARHSLANREDQKNGNVDRAVKHYIIAAKLGYEKSMKKLWEYFSAGHITKEELEATLRSHKAAIDETKSAQRDAAEAFFEGYQRGY